MMSRSVISIAFLIASMAVSNVAGQVSLADTPSRRLNANDEAANITIDEAIDDQAAIPTQNPVAN